MMTFLSSRVIGRFESPATAVAIVMYVSPELQVALLATT